MCDECCHRCNNDRGPCSLCCDHNGNCTCDICCDFCHDSCIYTCKCLAFTGDCLLGSVFKLIDGVVACVDQCTFPNTKPVDSMCRILLHCCTLCEGSELPINSQEVQGAGPCITCCCIEPCCCCGDPYRSICHPAYRVATGKNLEREREREKQEKRGYPRQMMTDKLQLPQPDNFTYERNINDIPERNIHDNNIDTREPARDNNNNINPGTHYDNERYINNNSRAPYDHRIYTNSNPGVHYDNARYTNNNIPGTHYGQQEDIQQPIRVQQRQEVQPSIVQYSNTKKLPPLRNERRNDQR